MNYLSMFKHCLIIFIIFINTNAFAENDQQARKIIVGGDQSYPPYTFINEEGEPDGHDVEMIKTIARLMNLEVEIQLTPWHKALDNLKNGKCDLLLTVLYTEERNQHFDYTIPYSIEYYSIFTHDQSKIKDLQDLQGKNIVVLQEDAAISMVLEPMGLLDNIVYTNSLPSAIEKVATRQQDYVLAPLSVVSNSLKKLNRNREKKLKLIPAGDPIFQSLYRLAVKKDNKEVLSILNEGIDQMKSNTDLSKLHQKWMSEKYQSWSRHDVIKLLAYILIPVVIVLFSLLLWSRYLRKQLVKSAICLQKEKEKSDSANRAKTFYLANMSHEIRTPLNTVIGFAQILLGETKKLTLPSNFKKFLENINTSAETLLSLINNILDISKIESGNLELNYERVDIKALVHSIHRINKVISLKKNIIFNYRYDPTLPDFIQSDSTRLNQILTNLINNAIKFTPPEKMIWLSAEKVESSVVFKIQDEGIGIPKLQRDLIFQPFKQVDGSGPQQYDGTGLGLSIVRELINLLKGTINLESQEGKGTIVTVSIPIILPENDKIK
jgi:signal transduction histidine kinase